MVQLEARVRTLEHASDVCVLIKKDNGLVKTMVEAYEQFLKDENKEVQEAGPSVKVFYRLLCACESFSYADTPPHFLQLISALKRLRAMIEVGGPEAAARWIRNAGAYPVYHKPGQPERVRLAFHLKGSIIVTRTPEDEAILVAEMTKHLNGADRVPVQVTPVEMPTWMLQLTSAKDMEVQDVVGQVLRGAGGAAQGSRAPKGNLARTVRKNG